MGPEGGPAVPRGNGAVPVFGSISRAELALRAPTFFLMALQLIEQRIEALEAAFPKPAVPLQPPARFRKRLRLEPAGTALRVAAARNQARALQHLEVLGDRGLTHRERLRQLRHRSLAGREAREDRPARWIGERGERRIETLGRTHHNADANSSASLS